MIADLLRGIASGGTTIALLAGELGVDRSTLVQRLLMMERMGYVARVSPKAAECAPSGPCWGCACHKECATPAEDELLFVVTGKGEAVIGRAARSPPPAAGR